VYPFALASFKLNVILLAARYRHPRCEQSREFVIIQAKKVDVEVFLLQR
jgi:hypothetical protein